VKNKEFIEFLLGHEAPPEALKKLTAIEIILSFRKRDILLKFFFFQLLGALFSLSVCPQFGLGLVQGHGITHNFRLIGDWACATFCGFFFLSSGMLVAFLGMKGEELWWVWRRYRYSLIFLPALLWAGLMISSLALSLGGETSLYHLMWIFMAIISEALWLELRSFTFLKRFRSRQSYPAV
jgi:hypothetical protein